MATPRFRLSRWLGLLILGAALASLALTAYAVQQHLPPAAGTLHVTGPSGPVTIVRDTHGIPHIYAQTPEDLFFAQGYVAAQDRLWAMALRRRQAQGRLAELLGSRYQEEDRWMRTLNLTAAARRAWDRLDEETRQALIAYAQGVNACLERCSPPLESQLLQLPALLPLPSAATPLPIAPWEPTDSLLLLLHLAWERDDNGAWDLLRGALVARLGAERASELFPNAAPLRPALTPLPALPATWPPSLLWDGGWAVDGRRTADGMPLLAMDLAAPPTLPSPWYVVGLHGGGYEVVGASLPGLPGVLAGHNAQIAWGLATGPGDDQDLYLEGVDWEGERVWTGTTWQPLRRREEWIAVAGQPAPFLLTVYETAHGPLIQGLLGEEAPPLALRWAVRDGGGGMQALLALNRAANWSDFRRALAAWDLWPVTALYADREGRIGWQRAGRLPQRRCDGRLPLPGDDPACDWQGFMAPDELPGRLDSTGGIVLALPGPQQRRERLRNLLAHSHSLSLQGAQAVASDLYPPAASWLLPALLRLEPQGWRQERMTAWLQEWEPTMEADDPGAAFLAVYRLELARAVLADDLGEDLFTAYAASTAYHDFLATLIEDPQAAWWDDRTTPERESAEGLLRRAYEAALEWLGRRYGDLHLLWRWDTLHGETLRHPLGEVEQPGTSLLNRRAELKGDATTVWASPSRDGESYQATALAGYRQIVLLSESPVMWAALLPGQSGHPLHPHYADLVDDWLEGTFFALTPPSLAP